MHPDLEQLDYYVTTEHECSYLEEQTAVTLFVDPQARVNHQQYSELARLGFRRSGDHIYRPHCPNCGYCIPVRVPVRQYQPTRSQRRNLKQNQDIDMQRLPAVYSDEHFALYRRYMQSRHPGGGMDNDEPLAYSRMLQADWSNSGLLVFRQQQQLCAVALVDYLTDGISAVYTYFDPDLNSRGLGVYAIQQQIELTRSLGLNYLYLGYWNPRSSKMSYKVNYQPIEFFDGQGWQILRASSDR